MLRCRKPSNFMVFLLGDCLVRQLTSYHKRLRYRAYREPEKTNRQNYKDVQESPKPCRHLMSAAALERTLVSLHDTLLIGRWDLPAGPPGLRADQHGRLLAALSPGLGLLDKLVDIGEPPSCLVLRKDHPIEGRSVPVLQHR